LPSSCRGEIQYSVTLSVDILQELRIKKSSRVFLRQVIKSNQAHVLTNQVSQEEVKSRHAIEKKLRQTKNPTPDQIKLRTKKSSH